MSLSRNVRCSKFQRHRPATEKLLSPNWRIDYFVPLKFTDDCRRGGAPVAPVPKSATALYFSGLVDDVGRINQITLCLVVFARWRHQSAAVQRAPGRNLLSSIALFVFKLERKNVL